MEAFPAFFPLGGKRVIIAGEGEGADAKLRLFAGSPAAVDHLTGAAAMDPSAYAGAVLAFVASGDDAFRGGAVAAARAAHVPLNVVDHPELCDFHTPAVIDRGQVVAAVGTAGASPMLAAMIRADVEAHIPPGAGRVAALLQRHQDEVRRTFPDLAARRAFLRSALTGPAAQAAIAGDMDRASDLMSHAVANPDTAFGRVAFIVGVEKPELMSLRAARALAAADVIIAPPSAEAAIADHARRDAPRLPNGDAVEEALQGRAVAVVGPAPSEASMAQLRAAAIAFEIHRPAPAP